MNMKLSFFLSRMDGRELSHNKSLMINSVSTDTRTLEKGAMYFAISGENFNGHDYIADAYKNGAVCVVAEKSFFKGSVKKGEVMKFINNHDDPRTLFLVDNSREALGEAAGGYREYCNPKVIAVTGSSGKTTTRKIIGSLIDESYRLCQTKGNFNNDIGLPKTIFTLDPDDDVLLVEMGMNHADEIRRLAEIAKPDIAVVTNVGTAHIEFFKDRAGIASAKKEIFSYFNYKSTAVLNKDDDYFTFLRDGVPGIKIEFGMVPDEFSIKKDLGYKGYVLTYKNDEIKFPLGGEFNLYNLSAAVAVAKEMGVSESVISRRIEQIHGLDGRTEVLHGRLTIINDCYNANPDSMRQALHLLGKTKSNRRIAVLGDMFELGGHEDKLHRELGVFIADNGLVDVFVAVGDRMKICAEAAAKGGISKSDIHWFNNRDSAVLWLEANAGSDDLILLKASRGMHFEKILENLEGNLQD